MTGHPGTQPDGQEPLVAGLDVGTSRVKAAIFDLDGEAVSTADVPTPTCRPRPGWAQHDPEQLWEAAAQALRCALAEVDQRRVVSVASASMAEAGVPLDRLGAPTYPAITWFDPRTAEQGRQLADIVGADRLAAITGLRPQPIYGVCKLAWLAEHEPDAYARTRVWLHVADYLAYRLCGEQATDYSLATRTGALDLHRLRWSEEILEAAGVRRSLLPEPVWGGTPLGAVTDDAAAATGLPAGATVTTGGHDHVCGAAGAGVVTPGRVLDSTGTAESILLPTRRPPRGGPRPGGRYSCGAHVIAGRWYVAGGVHAAGASLDWAVNLVCDKTGSEPDDQRRRRLLAAADRVPPGAHGVCFLPDLRGGDGSGISRAALLGLRPDVDGPTLVRGVLEGLAFAFRHALDTVVTRGAPTAGTGAATAESDPAATTAGSPQKPEIRAIGGGARNRALLRIKATVVGRMIERVLVTEAAARGAALLGAAGAGLFADAEAAVTALEPDTDGIEPDRDQVADYQARFEVVAGRDYTDLRTTGEALARLSDPGG